MRRGRELGGLGDLDEGRAISRRHLGKGGVEERQDDCLDARSVPCSMPQATALLMAAPWMAGARLTSASNQYVIISTSSPPATLAEALSVQETMDQQRTAVAGLLFLREAIVLTLRSSPGKSAFF